MDYAYLIVFFAFRHPSRAPIRYAPHPAIIRSAVVILPLGINLTVVS